MKVCHLFELKTPTPKQITGILEKICPTITQKHPLLTGIQGDLRKLNFFMKVYAKKPELFLKEKESKEQEQETKEKEQEKLASTWDMICMKSFNDDTKKIVQTLIQTPTPLEKHNFVMNETERTTVALLWHENIVDALPNTSMSVIQLYLRILKNICFSDYIDRITFQYQIWQFNEMSSLLKTFYSNKMFHTYTNNSKIRADGPMRFTKVLTKYSTEYNNTVFVHNLCNKLDMDRKDLFYLFQEIRLHYPESKDTFLNNTDTLADIERLLDDPTIKKLDIKRMYRYLDKTTKKVVSVFAEEDEDDLEEEELDDMDDRE